MKRFVLVNARPGHKDKLYNIGMWRTRAAALRYAQGWVNCWKLLKGYPVRIGRLTIERKAVMLKPKGHAKMRKRPTLV